MCFCSNYRDTKLKNEMLYWLYLLHKTHYLTDIEYESINNDAEELVKLPKSIRQDLEGTSETNYQLSFINYPFKTK